MREPIVIWEPSGEPGSNYDHIVVERGISQDEWEEVIYNAKEVLDKSHSSGRPVAFGWTSTGRHLMIVWEEVDDDPRTVIPFTAYEVPPRKRRT